MSIMSMSAWDENLNATTRVYGGTGSLPNLRARRAEVWNRAHALASAAADEKRQFTWNEQGSWDTLNEELADLDARIGEIVETEKRAKEADEAFAAIERKPQERSFSGEAKGLWLPSRSQYRKWVQESESRAIGTSGAFIPTEYSSQWWDRLRANSVVLAAGPTIIPVEGAGSINVPKITASVTISALAENTAITASDPTLANVLLDPKKVAGLTLIANEALDDSRPQLREIVAQDLIRQTATELDNQFLNGSGSGANMTGIRNISGTTAGPSLGANGGTPTLDNYADMVGSFETANGNMSRAVWLVHPRSWSTIRKIKDSQSRYQVNPGVTGAEERSLFGIPVRTTTNLPVNLTVGTSSDCSVALLVDMEQLVIARSRDVEVQLSTDYAFNADQTALRVTARFDIALMQAASTVVMTGVRP